MANATYTGTFIAGNWDTVRIVNNNSRSTFDDIVIGITLDDVYSPASSMPEPSSVALAGLAMAGLWAAGRRRGAP